MEDSIKEDQAKLQSDGKTIKLLTSSLVDTRSGDGTITEIQIILGEATVKITNKKRKIMKNKIIEILLILIIVAFGLGAVFMFAWGSTTIIMALSGQRSFTEVLVAVMVVIAVKFIMNLFSENINGNL